MKKLKESIYDLNIEICRSLENSCACRSLAAMLSFLPEGGVDRVKGGGGGEEEEGVVVQTYEVVTVVILVEEETSLEAEVRVASYHPYQGEEDEGEEEC